MGKYILLLLVGVNLVYTALAVVIKNPNSIMFMENNDHYLSRNKRFVQLEEGQTDLDSSPPRCSLPGGQAGQCRPINYCKVDIPNGDFSLYAEYLCVINGTSIGNCCPEKTSVQDITALAGDLPQTAFSNEDSETLLRIVSGLQKNRGCGVSTVSSAKLMGARPADPREWPWMVAVMADGREQYCGGSLITDQHVLTAAHCTRRWKAIDMQVRLGEYDFTRNNDSRSYDVQVIEIRQHKEFQLQTYRNDISILKLERRVVFNTYVWPICLPPVGRSFVDQTVTVAGWGTEFFGGPTSPVLMQVSVPVWSHDTCQNSYTDTIYDTVICAGGYDGGQDSCQGDSGGPLMYQMESGRWTVVGIVSWGIRCGEKGRPGVYTDVQKYLRWIVENTRF